MRRLAACGLCYNDVRFWRKNRLVALCSAQINSSPSASVACGWLVIHRRVYPTLSRLLHVHAELALSSQRSRHLVLRRSGGHGIATTRRAGPVW
jgi:hypothetical protein